MRSSGPPSWRGAPGWGPGRHIRFRIFGFLFFLFLMSAVVGGLVAWVLAPGRGVFLVVGLLLIVGFGLVMRSVFRRNWTPMSELIDATTRLGEGDTSVRMEAYRRGPWSPVSTSFNSMAERLEAEDERRRRLLADLGHELRTPLSVVRGEIEAVIDGVHNPDDLRNVVDEVSLMERLLEDLRTLALAESGALQLVTEPTDLGELATDVVTSFTSVMRAQAVRPEVSASGSNQVVVDPHRMHQVVANLISNALTQMPSGGRLEVGIEDGALTVADTGPGIPEDQLLVIFDRFETAGDSRRSGLGLSIARDLVELHGGTITAANRAEGGAVFTVDLG